MGGEGSGRHPDPVNMLRAQPQPQVPIGNEIFLPNYSGLQAVKKTDPAIGTGGSGHTIQEEGAPLTARTNLNFSGAAVTAYDDAVNDATVVSIVASGGAETDPVFMSLSGSIANYALSGGATVTLGVTQANVLSLSGSAWTHILSGSTAHGGIITSGSTALFALSGGATVSLGVHMLSGSDAHVGGIITSGSTALFALSGGATVSLGVHAADSTDPHGADLTQTNLYFTSGSRTGDMQASGALYVPNAILGYTSGAYTASDYPLGTILFIYAL